METPEGWKIKTQVPPSGTGTDKDLQGNAGLGGDAPGAKAFIFIGDPAVLPDGCKDLQKHFVLQGMYNEMMLELKQLVSPILPV